MRRLLADDRAGVTILAAMSMTACLGAAALAIDVGAIYFDSRRLQGIADAAALAAAADLGRAGAAASAAVTANGWSGPVDTVTQPGRYQPDPAIAVADRFTVTGMDSNAARVSLSADARLFFGVVTLGQRSVRISRSATAARADLASFTIGSRLAAVEGGIANALLGALTGSQINLSVMDYEALLAADIDLLAFSDALRTELGLEAASFDDVLATEIAAPDAIRALAQGLNGTAAVALGSIADATSGDMIRLDRLIDLGPIGAQDRVSGNQEIQVNAFDLARAMLELANGERQVALDLGAAIPGIAETKVTLAIGDRPSGSPWLAVSEKGETVIRTAQTRLYIDTRLLPAGSVMGIGGVRLPLFIELAEAEAKLSSIACGTRSQPSVSLLVRPSIGHVSIADIGASDLADHKTPATESVAKIVALPLVSVTGKARVNLTGSDWQSLSFDSTEIAARQPKTVSSTTLADGLATSLIETIDLDVNIGGLGLGLGPVTALVGKTLAPAAPHLDGLVNGLTGLLGIRLGQADVRVNGVRCGVPALVA